MNGKSYANGMPNSGRFWHQSPYALGYGLCTRCRTWTPVDAYRDAIGQSRCPRCRCKIRVKVSRTNRK